MARPRLTHNPYCNHSFGKQAIRRMVSRTTPGETMEWQVAAAFDRTGAAGEPITFGSHRRPQAVIVPWELWRQLAPVIEDVLDVVTARTRLENAGTQRIRVASREIADYNPGL